MTTPFFSLHLPSFTFPGVPRERVFDHVIELSQAAEAAGFDMVTVMDHFYQIRGIGPETEPMLEAHTTLGALANATRRVKLATMVSGVTYRNPALLVKMVTTLDTISHGRAVLGIGAAWNEDEHRGYGFEFPPIGRRMDRLEEALQIARLMFTEDRPSFEGRYYRIDRALNVPRPIQPGGPKILVGGMGEKRTLRLVARYADMSHWFPAPLEEMQRKEQILIEYCREEGRDQKTIMKTMGSPVLLITDKSQIRELEARIPAERRASLGEPVMIDEAAERLRPYLQAGFVGFTFNNPNLYSPELIHAAGELKKLLTSAPATVA